MKRPSIINAYKGYLQGLPMWVRWPVGVVAILAGLWLLTKPFYSLRLMVVMIAVAVFAEGIVKLVRVGSGNRIIRRILGVVMLLGGVLILVFPGVSVQLIALVVGVSLVVSGLSDVVSVGRTEKYRVTTVIVGLSTVVFGALALIWQDMALLILSFAFGIKLILTGVSALMFKENKQVASKKASARRGGGKVRGVMRSVEAALLAVMAIGLIGIGLKLHEAVPTPDDFYSWAGEIPDAPGKLLRYETYTQAVPDGVKGWRILYSTTRDETGVRAVASAFVMAPETESDEPMPVVAWAHGTTGVVPGAAPTVLPEPFPLDSTVPAVRQIFENGWVIVGTDYIGLGTEGPHPYLIGQGEARSVLDSVRAAKQLPGLRLADKTVVWGHSQGGHAALWTGGIAETYAPDVNVVGVAAAAPATDLPVLLRKVEDTPVGKIMGSFAIRAYSEIYPDVKFDDYVDPFLRPVVVSMSGRALAESSTLLSVVTALAMPGPIFGRNDPMAGALGRRLDENIPVKHIAAKLFVAQGDADPLVLPAVQEAYIAARRAAGQELTYKIYPGLDHLTLVNEASPFNDDLTEWTKRIFAD